MSVCALGECERGPGDGERFLSAVTCRFVFHELEMDWKRRTKMLFFHCLIRGISRDIVEGDGDGVMAPRRPKNVGILCGWYLSFMLR